MPTTQRLLTDTTGQALVTAVNNIVAAVKPNATEIQMSSSDTTTVATAITNINNKIGTVPSGQTVEDLITTLNSKLATKNGTVTAAQSGANVVNFAVRQSGNVVTVNGYISGLTIDANTYTHIATVSGISLPPYIIRARCAAGNNAYTTGNDAYIEFNPDGKISIYAAGASNTIYVSFSYIV